MSQSQIRNTMLVAAMLGAACVAHADIWHYSCNLDGSQVTPPTTSDATGTAVVRYDTETRTIEIDVYAEGITLDDDLIMAHFHIGRKGFAGPWVVQLGPTSEWFEDGNGIRRIVTDTLPEQDEHYILTDGTHIMLHSNDWPGGEIRGQVIADPRLSITSVARSRPSIFQVIQAEPGETVYIVYSRNGIGESSPIPYLGGLSYDLNDPPKLLTTKQADAAGSAVYVVTPPENTPLMELVFQAAIRRGTNGSESVKSNTVSTAVLP